MSVLLTRLRARRAGTGERGFTLVELLVVVFIIGILIAIAIPVYLNYQRNARDRAAQSDARSALGSIESCRAQDNAIPLAAYPGYTASVTSSSNPISACGGQNYNLSDGTTLYYTVLTGGDAFTVATTNAKGSGAAFCFNSSTGGSVRKYASGTQTC